MYTSENLFHSPAIQASAWIDRWSTESPGVKGERIGTGHGLGRMAVEGDTIWIANATSQAVTRVGRRGGRVEGRTKLHRETAAIAVGTEAVWVLGANGWLWRFHPDGTGEGMARTGRGARDLVCDHPWVWVLRGNGELRAIDQANGETTVEAKVRRRGRQILRADDNLIALTGGGRWVSRIARDTGAVEVEVRLPARGVRAALHDDKLWVACDRLRSGRWGALVRVDLATMRPDAVHELPNAPRAIAAGAGYVWVACGRRGNKKSSVVRVEPNSGEIMPWAETDWTIYDLALAEDELLAACGMKLVGPGSGGAQAT